MKLYQYYDRFGGEKLYISIPKKYIEVLKYLSDTFCGYSYVMYACTKQKVFGSTKNNRNLTEAKRNTVLKLPWYFVDPLW